MAVGATLGIKAARGSNRYYQGPVSDHFDGVRFFIPGGSAPNSLSNLLRWRLSESRESWPDDAPNPQKVQPDQRVGDRSIAMAGLTSLLIQTAGINLLADSVWSDRVSPVSFAGPRRVTEPGIEFDELPPIDGILLTHSHYDHLDLKTLQRLVKAHDPTIFTRLGNETILKEGGVDAQCVTGDWGDDAFLGPLRIHFKPCHHRSARGLNDRSMALYCAFVIEGPAGTLFHIGDTGFDSGRPYADIKADHGPLRAAFLPVGAYEPRWFMRGQHPNPQEAVQGFIRCSASHAIGHHRSTLQLTDEARMAPVCDLTAALLDQGISADRIRALVPGETWEIPPLIR